MSPFPEPVLPIAVAVAAERDATLDLRSLPTRPGVFVFEDGDGNTLELAITANLRRLVKSRFAAPEPGTPSRHIDYRAHTRVIRAVTVGSAFEADWVYLQLARKRRPSVCATLADRWCGWFVHCDPDVEFPRLQRLVIPGCGPGRVPGGGVTLGPFRDKHVAQRVIEQVEDVFDLCRYHHILVEAPRGNACAYKEMGRCAAPCDGSVPMSTYRETVAEAVRFLAPRPDPENLDRQMREASAALDFEHAERLRRRAELARLIGAGVDRLDRFRFLVVLPSERGDHARLFLVLGGWIEPWVDAPLAVDGDELADLARRLESRVDASRTDDATAGLENIGLVCWHFFRAADGRTADGRAGDGRAGELVPLASGLDASRLAEALRRLADVAQTDDAVDDAVVDGNA